MPAITIYGKMGSNKTHFATLYGLFLANRFKKKHFIANYQLSLKPLYNYCYKMGFDWLCTQLRQGNYVKFIDFSSDGGATGLNNILSVDNSIVLFDEVALYCPSRGSTFSSTKTSTFHKNLTQIRHRKLYLLAIAQNHQQIDSAIRNLAEEIFHCQGVTFYDEILQAPRLYFKRVDRFTPDNYEVWVSNAKLRRHPIKTRLLRNKSFSGILTKADSDLFNVFSSFDLVHDVEVNSSYEKNGDFWDLKPYKGKNPSFTSYEKISYAKFPYLPVTSIPSDNIIPAPTRPRLKISHPNSGFNPSLGITYMQWLSYLECLTDVTKTPLFIHQQKA